MGNEASYFTIFQGSMPRPPPQPLCIPSIPVLSASMPIVLWAALGELGTAQQTPQGSGICSWIVLAPNWRPVISQTALSRLLLWPCHPTSRWRQHPWSCVQWLLAPGWLPIHLRNAFFHVPIARNYISSYSSGLDIVTSISELFLSD